MTLVPSLGAAIAELPMWFDQSHDQIGEVDVPSDFLGVNVASSEDPASDDYVVACLEELGISRVRLTWAISAEGSFTERFLDRLVHEQVDVLVSVIPEFSAANAMAYDERVQSEWRDFVTRFLDKYGRTVHAIEVGNTPNRPRWSGFTPASYVRAWQIADEVASERGISLAGANVSDFEPAFNSAYLRAMTAAAKGPSIQTTNLFVERARQPEAYDRKALGRVLSRFVRLNLVKKVHILRAITDHWRVKRFYVTYTCWTRPRLLRWSVDIDGKGSDYLARYIMLAAATGGIDRLYWGPLIDGREGLVSCEGDAYPEIDNVTHYRRINGSIDTFKKSPSFAALKFVADLVQGARCEQAVTSRDGVNHVILVKDSREHHVIWTTDRHFFEFDALYPDLGSDVVIADAMGSTIDRVPGIGERPLILTWPADVRPERPTESEIRRCKRFGPRGTQVGLPGHCVPVSVRTDGWHGIVSGDYGSCKTNLVPDQLLQLPVVHSLRDKRNKLWTVDLGDGDKTIVVKENRARGIKRLSYHFLQSKGLRHWNNAQELLRRGVSTPQPIAFFEREKQASVRNNYYLSEYIADTHSVRDVFTAFKSGQDSYEGLSKRAWLGSIGEFVASIHQRTVTHADLSSGNMLCTISEGEIKFYLIDIGRARFDDRHNPFADIARVCYKLDWPEREVLMTAYLKVFRLKKQWLWRIWCKAYDYKLALKKSLKSGMRRKRARKSQ